MDLNLYELAVLDYICGRPDRFLNAQFEIPYDGQRGGACPDFVVLDFSDTTAYIAEVTAAANCKGLMGRVKERESRWFGPLGDHLKKMGPGFAGWDLHVTLFVREEQFVDAEEALRDRPDASVISLAKVLFSWNWDWQQATGLPSNVLRNPTKLKRVHSI